ncbi:uncharacterized protein ARMOST_01719 [Armillaria ostoyae]|uniref:Uncharacterized protein n=1 Tax=Armillaria ostoyae TaxID=47428 RepID=A0A284QPU4_ARMOS|nr:uncharacterized protein ARMOST_01719 [Armillaria ostoyae]
MRLEGSGRILLSSGEGRIFRSPPHVPRPARFLVLTNLSNTPFSKSRHDQNDNLSNLEQYFTPSVPTASRIKLSNTPLMPVQASSESDTRAGTYPSIASAFGVTI